MQPLVSIIIPYYEGTRFISETLTSLLEQDYPRLEIIVVNDGSSESSLIPIRDLVSETALNPSRGTITLLTQSNQGQAAARNLGIAHAQGTIIGFLDQDDLWPRDRLTSSLNHLIDHESFSYDFIRGMTQKLQLTSTSTWELQEPEFLPVLIGAALYTRETITRVGLFDAAMREGEDFDWNARLNELSLREKRISETTLLWRKHTSNQSNTRDYIKNGQLASLKKKLERMRAATSSS